MKHLLMILLCWGVFSTMSGCYIAPYLYYGGYGLTFRANKNRFLRITSRVHKRRLTALPCV